MIGFLNYSQGRYKMVSEFKFFWGISKKSRRIRAVWSPDLVEDRGSFEGELIRLMTEEITRGIDEEIINRLTRRINGGHSSNYFDGWMNIGDNVA